MLVLPVERQQVVILPIKAQEASVRVFTYSLQPWCFICSNWVKFVEVFIGTHMMRYYPLVSGVVPPSFNPEKPAHISRIVYQLFIVFRLEGKRNSEIVLLEVELFVLVR